MQKFFRDHFAEVLLAATALFGVILLASDSARFVLLTPLFLLTNLGLLIYRLGNNKTVWRAVIIASFIGYVTEMIGVQTGMLFGDYVYGNVLGLKAFDLPLMLGPMWALVMLCVWSILANFKSWFVIPIAGIIATLYDVILEHFATRFGLWSWEGSIPITNYVSWFLVASLIAGVYYFWGIRLKKVPMAIFTLVLHTAFFLATLFVAG